MTKPRNQFFIIIGLLILLFGIAWFTFPKQDEGPAQVFPATVNRDCAPWDGSAFTVSIPMSAGAVIDISIYQSPDIKFPVTFSFPDETGQVGNVTARSGSANGEYEALSGEARFESVSVDHVVEGRFNFTSEGGGQFTGKFIAEWGSEIVYCG